MSSVLICYLLQIKYGWKFQKRPGVHAFLNELFSKYELVLYTREYAMVSSFSDLCILQGLYSILYLYRLGKL